MSFPKNIKTQTKLGFQQTALDKLNHSLDEPLPTDDPRGHDVLTFSSPMSGVQQDLLTTGAINRTGLFNLVENKRANIETVTAAILAWGGMRASNRNYLNNAKSRKWLDLSSEIRTGQHDRQSAYAAFLDLRKCGEIPGMRPAFFTKLIHFLMPRSTENKPVGCIMDQWAGCSINLLLGERLVLMNSIHDWKKNKGGFQKRSRYTVSDQNCADTYERFCCAIEALAKELEVDAVATDRALVSQSGAPWREYVRTQRQP